MKKWILRKVIRVTTLPGFRILCTFDNEEIKEFDLKPILKKSGPVIAPLKKASFFKKVFIEAGAPTWPNGFDICADLIFQKGILIRKKGKLKVA